MAEPKFSHVLYLLNKQSILNIVCVRGGGNDFHNTDPFVPLFQEGYL